MKQLLTLLFLGIWAVALAQAQTGEQASGDEGQAQEAAPGEQVDEGEENAGEENAGEESESEAVEEGPEEALEDLPPAIETNPVPDPPEQDEFPEADEEFEPGEEISEDYPVPLPSDI